MLELYNSYSKSKEKFVPITPGKIKMYVCGMTVYDFCHIGHARVMVCFDMMVRYLRTQGFDVEYVRNITDIDDKIINRAYDNNEPYQQLTQRFIQAMHDDASALHVLSPTHEPKATEYISQMIAMIETLITKGYAYQAENGDVYYAVKRFADFGRLSGNDLQELRAGTRVEINESKHDPLDFVLWKTAKPGEPSWPSPWGAGRPGWHIECSAMATHLLGATFDIHGGGSDLQFPHHENEIAQSEATTQKKFVNYWMHVGFVQVNHEKMSKSLGNFFTIREVLAQFPAEVIRYFLIASHYRTQINFSSENLQAAKSALGRLYLTLRGLTELSADYDHNNQYAIEFCKAMDDDFNTPAAIAVLFELARDINKLRDNNNLEIAKQYASQLKALAGVLGILQDNPEEFLQQAADEHAISTEDIKQLIQQRNQARQNKNWQEADRIRQQLEAHNIILEDKANETIWRRT